jgi:two-component system, OmpR family, copper resistance phosphate regulon response regulator CusR
MMMSRILLADREPTTAAFLANGLRANGFSAAVTESVEATRAAARSGWFDLLLLDAVPPCADGFTVLDALREARAGLPVIVLTGGDGIGHAPTALRGCGDDFVVKPYRVEELLARVRLRLRGGTDIDTMMLRHGPLELDLRARRARVAGRPVTLTAREFMLTETFLRNRGRVLSRQQLLSRVWEYGHDTASNAVDVYVCRLRRKLGPGLISTVRGMGYRLEAVSPNGVSPNGVSPNGAPSIGVSLNGGPPNGAPEPGSEQRSALTG